MPAWLRVVNLSSQHRAVRLVRHLSERVHPWTSPPRTVLVWRRAGVNPRAVSGLSAPANRSGHLQVALTPKTSGSYNRGLTVYRIGRRICFAHRVDSPQ